jgi:hypothetical protein
LYRSPLAINYDVLFDGVLVGRIVLSPSAPNDSATETAHRGVATSRPLPRDVGTVFPETAKRAGGTFVLSSR